MKCYTALVACACLVGCGDIEPRPNPGGKGDRPGDPGQDIGHVLRPIGDQINADIEPPQNIVAIRDCTFVGFSHDTYGFGAPAGHGPSAPCQVMKAISEGNGAHGGYQGVRPSDTPAYGSSCSHDRQIDVQFAQHPGTGAVANAQEGVDYAFFQRDAAGEAMPLTFFQHEFSIPCVGTPCDAGYQPLGIDVSGGGAACTGCSADSDWEPPELVRVRLTAGEDAAGDPITVATQNHTGGWVISDECECRTQFQYPDLVNDPPNVMGDRIQVRTHFPGETSLYTGSGFRHYMLQNYPCAVSEVVTESSQLSWIFAYYDRDAGTPTFAVDGNAKAVPAGKELLVGFRLLDRSDWGAPKCGNAPPQWNHYADNDDLTIMVGSSVLQPDQNGIYTAVISAGAKHVKVNFLPNDDGQPEGIEVAHVHVVRGVLRDIGGANPTVVPAGWSSDFRMLLQDASQCL